MKFVEVLELFLSLCPDCKRDFLRLVHSLYCLGLSGKMWAFRRPKLWLEQYRFAEDLAKIVQLVYEKKQRDGQKVNLADTFFQTQKMRDLLEKYKLLNGELESSLETLLLEKVIQPNEVFLYAVMTADVLLAERRRYTVQFWTTFLIGVLSITATIIGAYIGFLK